MALIVQKYGGTSVGSAERIKSVARRVARWKAKGHQLVVVVSAMAGETNRLIALARELQEDTDRWRAHESAHRQHRRAAPAQGPRGGDRGRRRRLPGRGRARQHHDAG